MRQNDTQIPSDLVPLIKFQQRGAFINHSHRIKVSLYSRPTLKGPETPFFPEAALKALKEFSTDQLIFL